MFQGNRLEPRSSFLFSRSFWITDLSQRHIGSQLSSPAGRNNSRKDPAPKIFRILILWLAGYEQDESRNKAFTFLRVEKDMQCNVCTDTR